MPGGLRDGSAIANASKTTYTLAAADVGHKISVKASYTDGGGRPESVTSDPTAAVAAPASPGARFAHTANLSTTEGGGTDYFKAALTVQPRHDVTLAFTINDSTVGKFQASGRATHSITFTPGNWNVPQTVALAGVDDKANDGDTVFTVRTSVASDDLRYDGMRSGFGLPIPNINATNIDDDAPDPEEVAELIVPAPGGLSRYCPRLCYLLLDEGRYGEEETGALRNLAAALFRLENSRTPADVERVLAALVEWLADPAQASLRRAFTVWLKRVLLPGRMPGVEFNNVNELCEVKSMLAERVVDWTLDWKQQGIEEGRKQGMLLGLEEGRQEGIQEGRQEGEVASLSRLLERRFGELDEAVRRRLQEADAETLLRWGDRLLTAGSAAEVVQD